MKHIHTVLLLISLHLSAFPALADNGKKEIAKSGWNVGVMPAFTYNNDLGFLVGALGQVFDHGDGSIYPNYRHKFSANVNFYTRGARQLALNYDSKYLIPGKRVTAGVEYMDNPLCGFYGFNGAVSPYHADLDLRKSADGTDGVAFYADHQHLFRTTLDLQGPVADGLTWIGGISYSWQRYSDVAFEVYDGRESLFHQYVENGLIPERDTRGHRAEAKGGLVYDTRDFEPNPARGLYATVTATAGASFSEGARGSLLISADFRHYLPLWPGRITFAYQLSYKGLIAGSLPFYALPAFAMRGSFGSRISGNGVAWTSVDLRFCLARFQLLKQNFELGLVGFADAGAVVQPHKLQLQTALDGVTAGKTLDGVEAGPYRSIFDPGIASHERLHSSAGGGFWFSMNRNFITAVEFGRPLDPQDGCFGVYVNLGFSF